MYIIFVYRFFPLNYLFNENMKNERKISSERCTQIRYLSVEKTVVPFFIFLEIDSMKMSDCKSISLN